jgi:hypothetical protein
VLVSHGAALPGCVHHAGQPMGQLMGWTVNNMCLWFEILYMHSAVAGCQ